MYAYIEWVQPGHRSALITFQHQQTHSKEIELHDQEIQPMLHNQESTEDRTVMCTTSGARVYRGHGTMHNAQTKQHQ